MPTYDYVCDGCGHAFELFQSMTDPVKRTCPKCKKKKLRRLIGAGGAIVFKGSGFYKTDYRSDSYKKGAAAESGSGSSEQGKSDGGKSDGGKKSEAGGAGAKGSGEG
jgi:putative FmdB family regulatory protein